MRKAMTGSVVMVFAIFALAESPATQQASTQPAANHIAALIAQMGGPQFQARADAEKALVAIGPAAEPALRAAATAHSASAEVRSRAKSAIDQIEDNLSSNPTYISIHAENASAQAVCADIASEAHCKIGPADDTLWTRPPGPATRVTLDLDRVPFCVAMQRFCKVSETQLCELGNQWENIWVNPGDGVWDQRDRVAFEATMVYHMHLANLGAGKEDRNDFLEMYVCFDPKLKVLLFQQPRLTVAQDENGLSLLPDTPPVLDWDSREFCACFGRQMGLIRPPHVGKRLAKVQGSIALRVITQDKMMKIPDLAKAVGTSVTAGNRKVDVLDFKSDGGTGSLHVKITALNSKGFIPLPAGQGSLDLAREFSYLKVTDATGKKISVRSETNESDDREIDWEGRFDGDGPLTPPFSLQWDVITDVRDITVPFEFRDLPLPD